VICLTRLNGQTLAVNSDLIKFVETSPDTVLTLINGEKLLVRESVAQVVQRTIAFRRAVISKVSETKTEVSPSVATAASLSVDAAGARELEDGPRG
jgi:flagellar protein FlbD